ncbi:heat shock factor 2-binding protein isoform X2 [Lissotriton helveticus]
MPGATDEFVRVRKRDLDRLTTEVMQMRDFLPRILNGDILESFQKLELVEATVEKKEKEVELLRMDCEHFRSRLDAAQAECMKEKKSKAVRFFTLAGQTIESFVKSLTEVIKEPQDLDSDEQQFVLGLAGVVTNVAAVTIGREFLVTSCSVLLDTWMQLLAELKAGLCSRLKVLMLMSLYNVSINLKGLKYISESPSFLPLLTLLLHDPDAEVCLHTLRLLQSVILEPEVFTKMTPSLQESLPLQRITEFSKGRHKEVKSLAQELLEDLQFLESEV